MGAGERDASVGMAVVADGFDSSFSLSSIFSFPSNVFTNFMVFSLLSSSASTEMPKEG